MTHAQAPEPRKYAIYVLGAGFSRAAGLPLATELWDEVCDRGLGMTGRASKFKNDLDDFIEFKSRCDREALTYETINFEEFLGFLDIEHFLGLRGSETWSDHGNEGQIVVKTLIGQILSELTPHKDQIPQLYIDFVRRLRPGDTIITFNYDILLERALEQAGVRYRLFRDRYKNVRRHSAEIDLDIDLADVVVLKMHGSIDWFDKLPFLNRIEQSRADGLSGFVPSDSIFNPDIPNTLTKVVEGPRFDDDPLREMYRLFDIERFYADPPWFLQVPVLISPSTSKVVYAHQVGDFWRGLRYEGAGSCRLVIIGYSLPRHDDYARQVVYRLVDNYQSIPIERVRSGLLQREPVLFIDRPKDEDSADGYRHRYSFVDWSNANFLTDGFNEQTLDML